MIFFQISQSIIRHPMLTPKVLVNTSERLDLVNSTNSYFANTGSELAHCQISCDLFIFTHGKNQYKNLATFADLARKSSGNLYYYPEFDARSNGMKFTNELYHCLTRKMAWEGVFRIRVSCISRDTSYGNWTVANNVIHLTTSKKIKEIVTRQALGDLFGDYIDLSNTTLFFRDSFVVWHRTEKWTDTLYRH